jgi:hypothetical protein
MPDDPFAVLGLPARRDLTDEDVRAAWRRIAAVTHPDLDNGGDPVRYRAAAAAYDTLRTSFGRGEALADLGLSGYRGTTQTARHGMHRRDPRAWRAPSSGAATRLVGHVGRVPHVSRSAVLGTGIVAVAAIAVGAVGLTPASIALLVGAVTWLLTLCARRP